MLIQFGNTSSIFVEHIKVKIIIMKINFILEVLENFLTCPCDAQMYPNAWQIHNWKPRHHLFPTHVKN